MICTFYSYKGGVGRSMAMANVGDSLARRGLKVLMIDFDLEAPGLERFFQINQEAVRRHAGLLELVLAYKATMSLSRADDVDFKDLKTFICSVYEKLPGGGLLDIMPAGRREGSEQLARYALSLRTLDWQDFYFNWQGELFFEWVRRSLTDMYDLVLVDSRTGVTEMGGICGYQLPDTIVMMCAANNQNLDGTVNMVTDFRAPSVLRLRRDRPLEIVVVPARIEQRDEALLKAFFERFESAFAGLLPRKLAANSRAFRDLMVPYEPTFAFEERVVSDPEQHAERKRIGSAFDRIAEAICLLADESSPLGLAAQTREGLAGAPPARVAPAEVRYDAARRFAGYDSFLDSGDQERELANELHRGLQARRLQVFFDRNDKRAGEDSEAVVTDALFHSRTLVVLIGARPLSEWRMKTLDAARRLQRQKLALRILPVLLPGSDLSVLSGTGLDESSAIDLRDGVGQSGLDQLVKAISNQPAASAEASGVEPFPGLKAFDELESDQFFGREAQANELERVVATHSLVHLVGASGCGKSSLVRAGLVPRLHGEKSCTWLVEIIRPGRHPVAALAHARSALSEETAASASQRAAARRVRRLLVIDELEEVFTAAPESERHAFFLQLREFVAEYEQTACVRLVLRSDFESQVEALGPSPKLRARIELTPMTIDELRQVLNGPAERAGVAFEPGLAERIVLEMKSEPNALPLLQILLRRLWQERRDGWLTNAAYDAAGGLPGIVAGLAEGLHESLDSAGRLAMQSLMLGLVDSGSGREDTRRRVSLETIKPATLLGDPELAAAYDRTLERLISAGLVRATEQKGERVIELAHESLIRGWERLRSWLEAEHECLRFRQLLDVALGVWQRGGRKDEALLRGTVLGNALARRRADPRSLTVAQVEFIDRSVAVRTRWRRSVVVSVLVVLACAGWLVLMLRSARTKTASVEDARVAESKDAKQRIDQAAQLATSRAADAQAAATLRAEGDKLASQGRFDDAIAKYSTAAEREPNNAQTVAMLGALRLRDEDLSGAEVEFGKAIELSRGSPTEQSDYYVKRADLRLAGGRVVEATADYERAVNAAPDNRSAWFGAGRGHERLADIEDEPVKTSELELAIKAYSDAIAKDPTFAEAYFNRGAVLERLKRNDLAVADFSKIATLDGAAPSLKLASNARALKLGAKPVALPPTGGRHLIFQFTDAKDSAIIAKVASSLRSPDARVEVPQRVTYNGGGQVRFFFAQDEQAAGDVKRRVVSALAAQGLALRVDIVPLDAKRFPKASPGLIEVWLPSLSAPVATAPTLLSRLTAE